MENKTEVTEFILLGLTDAPGLQVPLFMMFTLIYIITVVGNLGMITLILLDPHLHTPMYFFLSNLSLVDFGCSSAVTPNVIAGFLTGNKVISYNACAAQMFFFIVFGTGESYLLASMAYDRYAAVCKPLRYATTMTKNRSNVVNHFFCDVPAVTILSCSDKHIRMDLEIIISDKNPGQRR
ncbi:olfactory receptor 5B2-like [Dama dama]